MYDELGKVDDSQIFRLEPGIYLVQLSGHLSFVGSNSINELIRRDNPAGKHAVVYETTKQFTGYDPQLRTLRNNPALQNTSHIGIVTSNPLLRMVTASIALTLRTTTGIPMAAYSSVEKALEGARKALSR